MKLSKTILLTFIILIFVITGVIFFAPVKTVLAISNRKNPSQRYYSAEGYQNGFCISYTHSVNKGRVHDYYSITNNNYLKCDRTVVVSYGAGIPEPEETPGAVFTVLPNGYEISKLNRIVPKLTMAVGIIANHAITFTKNGKETDFFLTDYFAPQTSLFLQITRVSLFQYLTHNMSNTKRFIQE